MRRSWMVPAAWVAAPVLYVVLVGWLMLHGHLDLAMVLVVLAVLGLLGLAVWRWRAGHRRWAAVLAAGALVIVAATGWFAYSLNEKIGRIPGSTTASSAPTRTNAPRSSRPRPSTSC